MNMASSTKMSHNLDPTVSSIFDGHRAAGPDFEDEEDLIEALEAETENDPALVHLREKRLQQLHAEFSRAKSQRNEGFGTYIDVKDEKTLMDLTTGTKWVVVHFYKPDFHRCAIMDRHLEVRETGIIREGE